MALLTLWMSVSGGINWWEFETVLLEVAPTLAAVFLLYEALMILALLNIVTGIFVNDSMEVAQNDRELKTVNALGRDVEFFKSIVAIFKQWDADNSGTITLEEFTSQLGTHEIKALFAALGLEIHDAYRLFEALDVDGDFELEIDEFVMGCTNFRGQAKAIDIETLKSHNKRIMYRVACIEQLCEEQMLLMREVVDRPRESPDMLDLLTPAGPATELRPGRDSRNRGCKVDDGQWQTALGPQSDDFTI